MRTVFTNDRRRKVIDEREDDQFLDAKLRQGRDALKSAEHTYPKLK